VNYLAKGLATIASAALLSAAGAGVAAAAPAPHHGTHGGSHSTAGHRHGKPVDKLAGPRRAATQAITAQYRSVQRLVSQAAGLTGAHAAGLQTALAADLDAVAADRSAVAAATSVKALNALKAAATGSRHVAGTQFGTVSSVDALSAQAPDLTALVSQIQDAINALVADGVDASASQTSLDAIVKSFTDALTSLGGLADQALALSPTAAKAALHAVADAVEAALPGLSDALTQASGDLTSLASALNL